LSWEITSGLPKEGDFSNKEKNGLRRRESPESSTRRRGEDLFKRED